MTGLIIKRIKMKKQFYIKERYNPQLGTYYVPCGQMTKTQAKSYEKPIYGDNIMHGFSTELEYLKEIKRLKDEGNKIV
jgi:hypothetical protein